MDENWESKEMRMDDDMSKLIQHEYDHLDGILATIRAIDNKSFVIKFKNRRSWKMYFTKISATDFIVQL